MSKIISGTNLRGFFGGIILRGEGHTKPITGRLSIFSSKTPVEGTVGSKKQSLLNNMGMSKSVQLAEDLHLGSMLMWSEPGFSQFGFDLIAMMQAKYEVGRLSSFYGMGTSEWEQHKP